MKSLIVETACVGLGEHLFHSRIPRFLKNKCLWQSLFIKQLKIWPP